jgi:GNAT superfamily N-acetyltransferase
MRGSSPGWPTRSTVTSVSPQPFTPAIVRRDAFGRRARFSVFVAEVDRRVVGYASVIAGYNTDLAAPELWMLDLFVLPRWRSRGIGRALVTEVGREAMRRGLTCLGWGCAATMSGPSASTDAWAPRSAMRASPR